MRWTCIAVVVALSACSGQASTTIPKQDPPPPAQVCFCTNQKTNVACPPCDGEPNVSVCHHHDDACKACAANAGERDPSKFFCTTHPAP